MSAFWWGVVAFPSGLVALALFSLIVFGGWVVAEKWFENRFVRKNPGWHGDPTFGRRTVNEGRVRWLATAALAPKAASFRIGFGSRLIFLHGYQHAGWRPTNRLVTLITKALEEHEELDLVAKDALGKDDPSV